MARRALIAAVLSLLAAACPAAAAERGIDLGKRAFGALACGEPAVGTAAFSDPAKLAGADPSACRIVLNRRYEPDMAADMRCTLLFHEYGHLAGREHSADPDSIMYREYLRPDPRCRAFSASSRARRGRGTSGTAAPRG